MENNTIEEAVEKLNAGDLIRFNYKLKHTNIEGSVIAKYMKHNSQKKDLMISDAFSLDRPISRILSSAIHHVEYREIYGLERLIPEKLL